MLSTRPSGPPLQAIAACALVVTLLLGGMANAQPARDGSAPAHIVTDRARMERVEVRREVHGELRAALRSSVASQQAGLVVQLVYEPGDRVEAGKVIAKLDDRAARLLVAQAEASLASHRALVTERQALADKARSYAERCEAAFKASGATQSDVDNARTALAESEARLAQAQADAAWADAAVSLARKQLGDLTIRAPFSGTVAANRTATGQWLDEGGAVIDLIALDSIDAWLDVPQELVDRLRPKSGAATIQLIVPTLNMAIGNKAADRPANVTEAPIAGIVPVADPTSRLFPVRVRIDNKDGRLRPGMSVIGLVPSGSTANALTLSRDAVLFNGSELFVYYDKGGAAAVATVSILCALGDRLAVSAPLLSDGTGVIVGGYENLAPGQPLTTSGRPTPAGSEAAAASPAP